MFRTIEAALAETVESSGAVPQPPVGSGTLASQPPRVGAAQTALRLAAAPPERYVHLYDRLHRPAAEPRVADEAHTDVPPLGYALAQLSGIYVLAENRDGLIIVDMHAAHERITYERMKQELASAKLKSQPLLVPIDFAVTAREADLAEECAPSSKRSGLRSCGAAQKSFEFLPYRCCCTEARSRR